MQFQLENLQLGKSYLCLLRALSLITDCATLPTSLYIAHATAV